MPQIPLLSGYGANENADFVQQLPVNLEAVPGKQGISNGSVRSAPGAEAFATGPGIGRGGIEWNGICHRVMGTKLVTVSATGTIAVLGDVGGAGPCSFTYGFGRLAIRSGTNLYYWDGTTLAQVTDPDLGPCLDVIWEDGYFISTDGTAIVVTDLSDPMSISPLKYGSAEADPDMVTGLLVVRDELVALGANTCEFFQDVGGAGFPFQVNNGATIPIGCVGPQAKCLYSQTFAFVGAGRNHATAVWMAAGGSAQKLSTRAVDDILAGVTDQTSIQLEARVYRDEERLYVHLPNQTLVYLFNASQAAQEPIWYIAASGQAMDKAYRLRNAILCYGEWIVEDTETAQLGKLSDSIATHFGEATGWRFVTNFLYNSGKGFIVHALELIGLPGRGSSVEPTAFLSYSKDGETWSMERAQKLGGPANRSKRMLWNPHTRARNYLMLKFRGDSTGLVGFAALEADVEALSA